MITRIATLFTLLALAPFALAQPQDKEVRVPPSLPAKGTDLFRGLLNFSKIESVARFSPAPLYSQQMVIVYGKPQTREQMTNIANVIADVTRGGGFVFIAISEPFDFRKLNYPNLEVVHDDLRYYGENFVLEDLKPDQRIYCPLVSSKPYGLNHLLTPDNSPTWNPFRGFSRIATNHPAVLTDSLRFNPDLDLAFLPPGCVSEDRNGPKIPANSKFAVFRRGGLSTFDNNVGNLTAIIMADEHVLSNQMIAMTGTDNLPFALKLISVLKGGSGANGERLRDKAFFYEYGEQKYQFDDVKFNAKPTPTVPPIPIPPPEVLDRIATPIADSLVDQLDKTNAHNRIIAQNETYYARLMMGLIIGVVSLIAMFMLWRLYHLQYRKDRMALPIPPLSRIKPARGLVGQMRQDLLIQGDYGTMVRDYIRELFDSLGMPAGKHVQFPDVHYKGNQENKPALLVDLNTLWAIGYGSTMPHVTITEWKKLEPILIRVWRAAEAGRWNFATSENS